MFHNIAICVFLLIINRFHPRELTFDCELMKFFTENIYALSGIFQSVVSAKSVHIRRPNYSASN